MFKLKRDDPQNVPVQTVRMDFFDFPFLFLYRLFSFSFSLFKPSPVTSAGIGKGLPLPGRTRAALAWAMRVTHSLAWHRQPRRPTALPGLLTFTRHIRFHSPSKSHHVTLLEDLFLQTMLLSQRLIYSSSFFASYIISNLLLVNSFFHGTNHQGFDFYY